MAVPRARLGGPFGGPSIAPRNELSISPVVDAVTRGATSLIENAFLRKLAARKQEQAEAAAKAQAEMQRQEFDLRRREVEGREADREAARLQAEREALEKANTPKAPVRGTPEFLQALEDELKLRNQNRPPPTPRTGTSPLDRQIDQARRDVPRIRPIGARERVTTDPLTGQQQLQPPLDPGAAQAFVQDSTAKDFRLRSLLRQRGDLPPEAAAAPPPAQPAVDPRAQHAQEIRDIRARGGGTEEIKAANERLRSALMAQPSPTLPPGMGPAGQPAQAGAADPVQSAVQWIRANPQQPNETDEAYKARYRAATGQQ